MRRALRIAAVAGALLVVAVAGGRLVGYGRLSASLPALDGQRTLPGLAAPVTVERDALGIPTIRGALARGRGARHGLPARAGPLLPDGPGSPARRRRAGGPGRARGASVDRGSASTASVPRRDAPWRCCRREDRAMLEAYRRRERRPGRAGGAAVRVPPAAPDPAPLARRGQPARRAVDVPHAAGRRTAPTSPAWRRCATCCRRRCSTSWRRAAPSGTRRSSACRSRCRRCRGPRSTTCAATRTGKPEIELARAVGRGAARGAGHRGSAEDDDVALGSNNWAVDRPADARRRARWSPTTCTWRSACPNTWYRARARVARRGEPGEHAHAGWHHAARRARARHRQQHARGVGLHQHLRRLERHRPAGGRPRRHRTAIGRPTAGSASTGTTKRCRLPARTTERMTVRWTIWGPVLGPDYGAARARTAGWRTPPNGWPRRITPLESRPDARRGLRRGQRRSARRAEHGRRRADGHIGWTSTAPSRAASASTARCPRRGRTASRGWNGWLDDAEYPRLIDPPGGRIWTANARVVDGACWPGLATAATKSGPARR